jgi:hypothetical protein
MYADPPVDALAAMTSSAGSSAPATSSAIRLTSARSRIISRSIHADRGGVISVCATVAASRPLRHDRRLLAFMKGKEHSALQIHGCDDK